MGLRFFRRKQLFPGLRLNVSKSGPSLSMGVRGADMTVGRRGHHADGRCSGDILMKAAVAVIKKERGLKKLKNFLSELT